MRDDLDAANGLASVYSPALHPDVVAVIAARLSDDERHRFTAELTDFADEVGVVVLASKESPESPDPAELFAALDRLVTVIRAWQLSVMLPEHPEWHAQRAEAEILWDTSRPLDDLGSIEDLRHELLRGGRSTDGDLIGA